MLSLMVPWLIIAMLFGVVVGLILGTYISSSLLQRHYRHFQATQTPPVQRLQHGATRYLDDDPYVRRPRR